MKLILVCLLVSMSFIASALGWGRLLRIPRQRDELFTIGLFAGGGALTGICIWQAAS